MIIPFPEPTELLEDIRKKHPYVKFTYKQQSFDGKKLVQIDAVPDGIYPAIHLLLIQSLTIRAEVFHDATILVTLFTLPSDPKLAPNLHLVHLISAGVDRLPETPIVRRFRSNHILSSQY